MNHGLEAENEVTIQRTTNMPGLGYKKGDNNKKEGWKHIVKIIACQAWALDQYMHWEVIKGL